MADMEVRINPDAEEGGDVEMAGGDDDVVEVGDPGATDPADEAMARDLEAAAEEAKPARMTFVE